ncbi:hypothetical protein HPB50_021283 [Hyalomma asiaticum]|uniref:Uncharacterized protein n=1 Tax=Hyalomma asiaticum TaxID=266040 RepID=A0ACB7SUD3_HYAAI|nr:hypothetical protein HPB50_021283 [Hyalomma asiaticum]
MVRPSSPSREDQVEPCLLSRTTRIRCNTPEIKLLTSTFCTEHELTASPRPNLCASFLSCLFLSRAHCRVLSVFVASTEASSAARTGTTTPANSRLQEAQPLICSLPSCHSGPQTTRKLDNWCAAIMDWVTIAGSLLAASLLYVITRTWLSSKSVPRGARLPPGPPGRPLVGHVQFTHKDFHCNQAMKWAKQYGPVYRIRTGSADMVILNDFASIKKFLTKKEVLYRPQNWLFRGEVYGGVATMNGETWVDNRRFCLHVLRDLGFGKTSMEEHVKDECQCLVEKIAEAKGAPIAIQEYIFPSTSNNIAALVYGSRYPFEHPRRRYLDELLSELFKAIRAGTLVEFLPSFVRKAITWLPSTRRTVIKSKLMEFIEYTKGQVADHKATMDEHFNRDFIDGYLKKIQEHENEQNPNFQHRFLLGNVLSFFIAGSNTVAVTIHWHMLNFANNPDTVQARVQREIDEVVGRERQPTWEDRNKMPYTMACIWEMYRWKTVSPLGVPRGYVGI